MQETSPHNPADKSGWRHRLRSRLKHIEDPAGQSLAIQEHLRVFLSSYQSASIAVYSSIPGEPPPLNPESGPLGHRWNYPRVDGSHLVFHQIRALSELTTGSFGIAEPPPGLPPVDPWDFDLVLCPGLGFDRTGTRLGRGKGHYDRILSDTRPGIPLVGVAYHEQLAANPDGILPITA